jgi:hypothetical protein
MGVPKARCYNRGKEIIWSQTAFPKTAGRRGNICLFDEDSLKRTDE